MTRLPDPADSRAVLIGSSRFPNAAQLNELPAVRRNLAALRQSISSPPAGTLDAANCVVVEDNDSVATIGRVVAQAATAATDLLLVYYAGHGLVDERGRLYLALPSTDMMSLRYSSLPVDLLREDIGSSPAAARVLILDCCFSGRAIEAMADEHGVITAQLDVAGTYILTATPANAPAFAPAGETYTAFTGALLRALGDPRPLSLDEAYAEIDRALSARNLPRPQRRTTNTAGQLALSRGRSDVSASTGDMPPAAETTTFQHDERRMRQARRKLVVGGSAIAVMGWSSASTHGYRWARAFR
jgi:uncharacterized caspase-like protein